jgi:hypothetical protein
VLSRGLNRNAESAEGPGVPWERSEGSPALRETCARRSCDEARAPQERGMQNHDPQSTKSRMEAANFGFSVAPIPYPSCMAVPKSLQTHDGKKQKSKSVATILFPSSMANVQRLALPFLVLPCLLPIACGRQFCFGSVSALFRLPILRVGANIYAGCSGCFGSGVGELRSSARLKKKMKMHTPSPSPCSLRPP